MHVEKNVCENVLGTLLNIEGKTKDTDKARRDLEDMKIRKELHPVQKDDRRVKPHASYVLTLEERNQFCNLLKSVRFPDGYAGNLAKNVIVEQGKVYGLNSHDCHVLIQRIIPIAIRPLMTKQIRDTLVELSRFFKKLTKSTLYVTELEALQEGIVKILCMLERIFPPSFFTVMVHLCVHLPHEEILGGPVQSRWMYPTKRYLGHLKKYVGNKAKPEGSIAEGYVVEEVITFCSHYLKGVDSKLDKHYRNDDKTSGDARSFALDVFKMNGRGTGKKEISFLHPILMKKVIWFIFDNCQEVEPYISLSALDKEHLVFLQRQHPEFSDFSKLQQDTFSNWFAERIREVHKRNPSQINEELYALSSLPDNRVTSYKGYIVNGIKFTVKSTDDYRQTQNCGVTSPGVHNDVEDNYYGCLDEVIEFSFIRNYSVVLFKCKWFDTDHRRKQVIFQPNFISVDTSRCAYMEDPFNFANQAQQVFYINDPLKLNSQWKIVERITHRHLWDIPGDNSAKDLLEDVNLLREDVTEEFVENVDVQGSAERRFNYIRDEVEKGKICIRKVHTDQNSADSLTKLLERPKHEAHTCDSGLRYSSDWI